MAGAGEGAGEGQRQLDMRTYDFAQRALFLSEQNTERMNRHEDECKADRRHSDELREAFRTEVATSLAAIRAAQQDSARRLHEKLNGVLFSLGGSTIVLLLAIIGTLFWKAANW